MGFLRGSSVKGECGTEETYIAVDLKTVHVRW